MHYFTFVERRKLFADNIHLKIQEIFGIMAHIDAGNTTTENFAHIQDFNRQIGENHNEFMVLLWTDGSEQERITITSRCYNML